MTQGSRGNKAQATGSGARRTDPRRAGNRQAAAGMTGSLLERAKGNMNNRAAVHLSRLHLHNKATSSRRPEQVEMAQSWWGMGCMGC
jgi:hypothetical protein